MPDGYDRIQVIGYCKLGEKEVSEDITDSYNLVKKEETGDMKASLSLLRKSGVKVLGLGNESVLEKGQEEELEKKLGVVDEVYVVDIEGKCVFFPTLEGACNHAYSYLEKEVMASSGKKLYIEKEEYPGEVKYTLYEVLNYFVVSYDSPISFVLVKTVCRSEEVRAPSVSSH